MDKSVEVPLNYYTLPEEFRKEVSNFIDFLIQKTKTRNEPQRKKSKGQIRKENYQNSTLVVHMSQDFDDPIEGFEPYM